jgi:hypothetical protein
VTLPKDGAPAKPQPPTVFVLANGEKLESHDYLLTASSLRIEVGRQRRIIPRSTSSTSKPRSSPTMRGIELMFPRNSGTVLLGF